MSIAPSVYDWGLKEYLQDTKTWMERGIVDIIHPQIYRRDFESYKREIDKLVNEFTPQLAKLAPGMLIKIGSYRISSDLLLQAIAYNRSCGISGEVFFFYEGLRQDNNALADVLRYNTSIANSALSRSDNKKLSLSKGIQALFRFWQNRF